MNKIPYLQILVSFVFSVFLLLALYKSSIYAVSCDSLSGGVTTGSLVGTYCQSYSTTCSCLPPNSCSCPDGKHIVCCDWTCFVYNTSDGGRCSQCDGINSYNKSCYPNGSSCTCCVPNGSCSCTQPVCPVGYTSTNNSCPITTSTSCSGTDNCGASCSRSQTCYFIETNTTFIQSNGSTAGPANITIAVDGASYTLSSDPNNPTHIKLPASGSSNVTLNVPTFTAPTTSTGGGYYFQADNYGVNDEWKDATFTCSGVDGEDFCIDGGTSSSSNTINFTPTSKTVNQTLLENAEGKISAMYYTVDKCDTNKKYSLPTERYYVVDYIPDGPVACTPGEPTCTILPDVGTSDSTTAKGCTTITYTGNEANNPLHITANVTDVNSIDEIQAYILWFSKDTTTPKTTTFDSTYSGSSPDDIGIMIKKNGGDWSNPNIYATGTNLQWHQLSADSSGNLFATIDGTNVIRVFNTSVTQSSTVLFDFKLEFLNTDKMLGMYNVYSLGLDSFMINGNTIDQSYLSKVFNWGIDLVNPTVNNSTLLVKDATNTYITWSVNDTTSGIDRTILSPYRVGGTSTTPVNLYIPTTYTTALGEQTPNAIPEDSLIGLYNEPWRFNSNTGEKDMLNIGDNESGLIDVYVTAYDKACNTSSNYSTVDLNSWFTTRGGVVYSNGSILSTPKDVSDSTSITDTTFRTITKDKLDLGTELVSSRGNTISDFIHPQLQAVKATNDNDVNDAKNLWYSKLLSKLSDFKAGLTLLPSSTSQCNSTSGCYYIGTSETDVTVPKDYICKYPTLFVSGKDMYITPNLTNTSGQLTGCIFLAKNNIYITGGDYLSDTSIKYDYIEGFFIAENKIIFQLADQSKAIRDGIEVKGSMIAFGSGITDSSSAIEIDRNLRLFNQTNPTVVMTYDNRYSSISQLFFGTEIPLYKQEVGFKSF